VRLHTRVIPATRLAGLAVVAALIPLHNAAFLGSPQWTAAWSFTITATIYGLASWYVLSRYFTRSKLHLGTFFLAADVSLLILAIDSSGGTQSWLFLLLAARCTDQLFFGLRRVIWFNHALVAAYAVYLLHCARSEAVPWEREITKLALLYAFNWYYALSVSNMDSMRRRTRRATVAKRRQAELAAIVSHSIRTRVNALLIVLGFLRKGPLNPKQQEYVGLMADCSEGLLSLAGVLGNSQETDLLPVHRMPFVPAALIQQTASLLRPLAESKGVDLRADAEEGTSDWVEGDAGKLQQALLSVAHNAVTFTDIGYVHIRAVRQGEERMAFEVRDSGVGIPIHMKHALFAPLFRADGSPWQRYRGRQVGLSISKRLVESMGGVLELESKAGMGTTIRFVVELRGCTPPRSRPFPLLETAFQERHPN
jgi:signal transduction histidine kinase